MIPLGRGRVTFRAAAFRRAVRAPEAYSWSMSEVNVEAGGLDVRHEEEGGRGAFFVEQGGRRVAELTYEREGGDRANLQHTQVSDALRGRGVARLLVDAAVAWARASDTRLVPLCPYAKAIFDRDASLRDVLV